MDVSRSRKTTKVLYLYLTIPLLIITAALGMIALMSSGSKKEPAKTMAPADAGQPLKSSGGSDAAWFSDRPSVEIVLPPQEVEKPPDGGNSSSTAGNAAIVTAIMGGLTGLMGAMTQTFVAFLKMRERRRSRSDGEEPDDQDQA